MEDFRKWVPNLLTISRLLFTPVVLILINVNSTTSNILAGLLFLFCCVTDFLDGYLARKWQVESSFGKTFDPLADKVLILGALILFIAQSKVLILLAIFHIIRDVSMDVMRLFLYKKNRIIPASFLAKLKTITQMLTILITIFFQVSFSGHLFWPSGLMQWITSSILAASMIFSIVSFWDYIRKIQTNAN
ncbi:CDP-diacylglycerol--glycerol-3-phosphate 3-phosphatidyltransferase [Candidatus Mycoplasma haematohominis]|uniref:CDP-diacylglycerol--glycerol-3-phosphate 3-phosphatidyltransferase n=1 Tax=Candidatus Mycoplasma haematohominis TaxID=1494318 RepID=A0A478FPN1_9MOLU|nr:CDP-diacylglycerol--glycerol-3-phosphate 3-phosphatidyltransferase [Candidatus Mycoplasma haemohominis]